MTEEIKKPVWKKWWFWVVAVFVLFIIIGNVSKEPKTEMVVQEKTESGEDVKTTSEPKPDATIGQKNALRSAENYLSFTAFSRSGLIDQLEFEGFSGEEAKYAADNCGANWNEQAAKSAENYLNFTSFSRSGLIDQLKFEGFTNEQAEYGVNAVGY